MLCLTNCVSIFQALGVGFAPFAQPVFQRCMDIIQLQLLAKVSFIILKFHFIGFLHLFQFSLHISLGHVHNYCTGVFLFDETLAVVFVGWSCFCWSSVRQRIHCMFPWFAFGTCWRAWQWDRVSGTAALTHSVKNLLATDGCCCYNMIESDINWIYS